MSEIGNQHYFIGGNPRDFDLAEVEVYVVRRDLGRRRKKILQRQEKMAVRPPPTAALHDSLSLILCRVCHVCRVVLRVSCRVVQEREKALKNSGWACSACTFVNVGSKIQCGVCATPRGKSKLFASSGSGALHLQNQRVCPLPSSLSFSSSLF